MLGDRRTDKAFGTKQVLWASSLQQLASSASTVCSFGHTVLVGPAGTDFNTAPFVVDELTIIGSRCGPFAPALRLLASGVIDVEPLISSRYPLEDGVRALEAAARRDQVKVLLET